jgi:hypothetical protein
LLLGDFPIWTGWNSLVNGGCLLLPASWLARACENGLTVFCFFLVLFYKLDGEGGEAQKGIFEGEGSSQRIVEVQRVL